jgi:molybdenum cofactor cytidylyltransferase
MIAVVILAAGSSTRFGSPKQNLVYNGQTLLQRAIISALSATETVLVVLGANRENIEYAIKDQPVSIIYNAKWQQGMATSISLAMEGVQSLYPQITSIIFMLCDQPFADEILLKQLINSAETSDKGIVACAYNNTVGVPVLFKSDYFPYLLALKGQEGAKKLLLLHADDVQSIPFSLGEVDIDTVEDFEELKSRPRD